MPLKLRTFHMSNLRNAHVTLSVVGVKGHSSSTSRHRPQLYVLYTSLRHEMEVEKQSQHYQHRRYLFGLFILKLSTFARVLASAKMYVVLITINVA